jgi:hypothetical protein
MAPLEAALLVVVLLCPLHWLVLRYFDRIEDPVYLRRQGIVIELESALDARSAPIGNYRGVPIAETVTFKGMVYRYDHVLDPRLRERIEPGQLFIAPGLVYVAV